MVQRAEEIQSVEPRMAYYCRLYAIKRGLELPKPTKEISGLIKATFLQCEKDKPAVKPDEEADRAYCENFALNVFRRADRVDRAARADMNTCKAYYAAAIFLQVLEQFLKPGEEMEYDAPDLLEKTRYALWRAAEIRKALREGRQPAPPPDAGTAVPGGAAGGSGDMFSGPAYEQSTPGEQQGPPPGDAPGSNLDSIASSTDDFLALPKPPSTVPPAGSTGLLAPAAAAGPRFRPGSRVWCCPPGSGGGPPEEGTVGMVLSPAGGPGGQAMYKVALRDRLAEVSDSQMAPAVTAGARLLYVATYGDAPIGGSVIAAKVDSWPCMYLLQLDTGRTLDTDAAHVMVAEAAAGGSQGQPTGYPAVGGGHPLPAAPPLVDPYSPPPPAAAAAPPAAPYSPPARQQQQQQGPAAPAAPPPPAASSSPYPSYPQQGQPQRQQQPQQPGSPYRGGAQQAAAAPAAAAAAPAFQMPVLPPPGSFQPSGAAISEAQKWAKFAVSSLGHDDVTGAVKFLSDALRLLTQPSGK
uniref:Vta1/callose synthase N-terminal domain-containing protein n=1 Tax=Tetradesmus obliquus TaxID=3088 RepID=A0A383WE14_TETOB|eukprot:jgi/Sobl393_1/207/SZX74946.1